MIVAYVDADWTGDKVDRSFTTRVAATLHSTTVLTFSRTQQAVAHSAAESGPNGIIFGARETLGTTQLKNNIYFKHPPPIPKP